MSEKTASFPYLLVASLCLNAAMLGLVGGTLLTSDRRGHAEPTPSPQTQSYGGQLEERLARSAMRDLPEGERRAMQRTFATGWRESAPLRRQLETSRAEIAELLAADEIDEAALNAVFDDIRSAELELREHFHDSLAHLLSRLPLERRQDLIGRSLQRRGERIRQWREERGLRPPPSHGRDDRSGPPPHEHGEQSRPSGPPPEETPSEE